MTPRLKLMRVTIFSRRPIWRFQIKNHGDMAKKKSAMTQRTKTS